jgi:hypothetical protein
LVEPEIASPAAVQKDVTLSPVSQNHKLPERGADPLPSGAKKPAVVNNRRTGKRGTGRKKITFTHEPSSTEEESESEK